jgi:hypothetical protein
MKIHANWLRITRALTRFVVPLLIGAALLLEFFGGSLGSHGTSFGYLLAIVFSFLTLAMIGLCGWVVFLWDIDRLFFRLERKIDAQVGLESAPADERDSSLLTRAREMMTSKVQGVRSRAIAVIEKAYWDDINAGGVLAFPQPNIAEAIEQIDESRRDLLAPLTDYVATALPLGSAAAPIVARVIFRYVSPEVKVRLYRRLILRFLLQLGALFVLTALCFYLSLLGWSRVSSSIFSQPDVSRGEAVLYQLDLMLRGALFDFMEHTQRSISPIRLNQNVTASVYYTLVFRMFVAVYVFSSLFRVVRFVARRWRVLVR